MTPTPATAIARGQLARAHILRQERRTQLADRVLKAMTVEETWEPLSPAGRLRARYDLERAFVLRRSGTRDDNEAACVLLDRMLSRVYSTHAALTPATPAETVLALQVDGDSGANLLNDIAVCYSDLGQYRRAIDISKQLLEEARNTGSRNIEVVELNNIAVRRVQLGYLIACGGDVVGARIEFTAAATTHHEALALRPSDAEPAAEAQRLRSEVGVLQSEFEYAVAGDDPAADGDDLDCMLSDFARRATDLFTRSSRNVAVVPRWRLLRGANLGMIVCEQARRAAARGDAAASELATLARCLIKPQYDSFADDMDVPAALLIRYADSCRLSGSKPLARTIYERALDFNATLYPAGTGAEPRLRHRLAAL